MRSSTKQPVLVRVVGPLKEELIRRAEQQQNSVAAVARQLIAEALSRDAREPQAAAPGVGR